MIVKLLILGAVLYAVYFIFFKKPDLIKRKKAADEDSETVVECAKCSVYVPASEAIIKDGKQYCSNECAELK